MIGAYRLPLRFDPGPLLDDVRRIESHARWIDHWAGTTGEWGVIPLVSSDGNHDTPDSASFTGGGAGRATALLAGAPHLAAAVGEFRAPVLHARLSRLRPGTVIHPHRDYGHIGDQRFSFERGYIRVHVPILTDAGTTWRLAGERIDMRAGDAWYVNVCLPHAVENASTTERIHLVLDLELSDWLRRLFPPESVWDRARGIVLRRFERPLWKLVKPILKARSHRAYASRSPLPAARDQVTPPEGQDRADGTIGQR